MLHTQIEPARGGRSQAKSLQLLPRGLDLEVRTLERRRPSRGAEHVIGAAVRALVGAVGGLDLEHFLAEAGDRDRDLEALLAEVRADRCGTRVRQFDVLRVRTDRVGVTGDVE